VYLHLLLTLAVASCSGRFTHTEAAFSNHTALKWESPITWSCFGR